MTGDFKRPVAVSNWGYWWELEGRRLQTGDVVDVLFPDDEIEREVMVTIVRQTIDPREGVDDCRAYLSVPAHGTILTVKLTEEARLRLCLRRARGE